MTTKPTETPRTNAFYGDGTTPAKAEAKEFAQKLECELIDANELLEAWQQRTVTNAMFDQLQKQNAVLRTSLEGIVTYCEGDIICNRADIRLIRNQAKQALSQTSR